ncbi:E3 ubiquitin-protein ligase Mdm2 isoform X2 [Halyomorpha halys]|uniref:E3 ubiquitin-protein ligase Mdm2 isoform X2 n=1 Tax=Halyomorpha halys TaxID=286706 RepID=UPI0006D51805|nr:E3 ubiquitin-protein ligase Mdm2-like isoform X2 [Halyomorpha halys]XP_024215548.1 E3 ubiquitin-protein ligase Mdm2-like isoform X2 [Halyomorpha halys]XP_024215549.1 E3 ubiquitin-protein ligase Mdm2-like isoform X2 [Halyomorpha halys]XP_024215550.1 E3 ubiquitin-protein ligase Mdm2-like isoform X2 [Halyomorpha halys]
MNRVATSSETNLFKRHRTTSDESDGELIKKPKYYYLLEPETTDYSSDGNESIYSIQARTTDTAKDTSDTSTKSEDSMVEFEVVSNSDDPVYPYPLRDSSSPPEDIRSDAITFEIDGETLIFSDNDACDNSSVTSEKERIYKNLYLFKTCVQCGQTNNTPLYRYCDKCYKVRKNFFPPRPRGRKNKTDKKACTSNSSNDDIVRSSCDSGIISELTHSLSEKAFGERTENNSEQDIIHRKELCGTCLVRSKDGGVFNVLQLIILIALKP